MCRSWSHYENRSTSEPTRSFFQALRDLFRRAPRPRLEPEVEADVVPLPARGGVREGGSPSEPDRPIAA